MDKATKAIGIVLIIALTIVSAVSMIVAIDRGMELKVKSFALAASEKAEKAWKDKYDEIKKTPAGDLVSSSLDSRQLVGARDKLVDEIDARLRDRARAILLGGNGISTHHSLGR